MEKIGIEKLKTFIVLLIMFGERVEDALEDDGKVKLFEALQIGLGLAPQVFEIATAAPQIKAEIADLSEAEKNEIVAFAVDRLDLDNASVEEDRKSTRLNSSHYS
mgnify:CR=1 FL=1